LKIFQVNARFTGGSNWYCYELSRRLAERGHEVHMLTSKLRKSDTSGEVEGVYVHYCPSLGTVWGVNPLAFILHKLLKEDFDVVHAHSYIYLTSNQAALAKRMRGYPFLIQLHGGIDVTPLSPSHYSTWMKLNIKRSIYDRTLGRWTVKAADAIASVSKRDMKLAQEIFGIDERKLHWVPNAVDLDLFDPNNNDPNNDEKNVTFIGALEPWKGVHSFLEIAKLLLRTQNDLNFIIVGEGSLLEYAKEESNKGILRGRVNVLEQIPHEEIPKVLSETSVLVVPSYMEGLPTVCLEAMALQVPVVASNIGGIPEIVIDGETGYLFNSCNLRECAEKVLEILLNEKLRRKMGSQCRRLVKQHYTWDNVTEKVQEIYEEIWK